MVISNLKKLFVYEGLIISVLICWLTSTEDLCEFLFLYLPRWINISFSLVSKILHHLLLTCQYLPNNLRKGFYRILPLKKFSKIKGIRVGYMFFCKINTQHVDAIEFLIPLLQGVTNFIVFRITRRF